MKWKSFRLVIALSLLADGVTSAVLGPRFITLLQRLAPHRLKWPLGILLRLPEPVFRLGAVARATISGYVVYRSLPREGGAMNHTHRTHLHAKSDQTISTAGKVLHSPRFYDFLGLLTGSSRRIKATISLSGLTQGQSVLDVGCGTGNLALAAKAAVGSDSRVSGIDPAAEMVEFARRKAANAKSEVDFRAGAVEALPFADASFDVVLSTLALHHIPEDVNVRASTK
jgi:phospholipid N-methyltransferase